MDLGIGYSTPMPSAAPMTAQFGLQNTQPAVPQNEPQNNQMNMGPPIPSSGLPEGWTMEQWSYYGSAWLSQQEENLNNTPQISNVIQQEPVNVQDDSVFDLLSNESNTQQKSDPLSAFEDDDLDF